MNKKCLETIKYFNNNNKIMRELQNQQRSKRFNKPIEIDIFVVSSTNNVHVINRFRHFFLASIDINAIVAFVVCHVSRRNLGNSMLHKVIASFFAGSVIYRISNKNKEGGHHEATGFGFFAKSIVRILLPCTFRLVIFLGCIVFNFYQKYFFR